MNQSNPDLQDTPSEKLVNNVAAACTAVLMVGATIFTLCSVAMGVTMTFKTIRGDHE